MGDRGYRGCEYVEVCESKEQKGIRQVEERDYLTCLPLWLRYRLQLFQEVSNMGVIFHQTYRSNYKHNKEYSNNGQFHSTHSL